MGWVRQGRGWRAEVVSQTMGRRDAIVAAVALALGAAAMFESSKLTFGTIHSPAPGFFPWWTSVLIVLLALVLMVQALTGSSTAGEGSGRIDRKCTRLNSSHRTISYAVFCFKKKKKN